MSKRSRIFAAFVVVYLAAVAFLLYRVAADIDPRYRESAEESLVDTAQLLATLLERNAYNGTIPTDELERTLAHLARRPVYAQIFEVEKTRVDLHVYVTDANGIVVFNSHGVDLGADYRAWRDVKLTLEGAYGARTTLAVRGDPNSAVMYVGAAIREQRPGARPEGDEIIGMVSVGKPIAAFRPFIVNARWRLAGFGALAAAAFGLLLLTVTVWLVRPFGLVRDLWRGSVGGDAGSIVQRLRRFVGVARSAFADLRDTVTGRSYVDEYVQTLAHELKSPLAAIRGAAELLREPMPEDTRARFAGHINDGVAHAQSLIDRMLELSGVERRRSLNDRDLAPIAIDQLVELILDELAPIAARRGVRIERAIDPDLVITADPFLLRHALSNLVANAIDFAPADSAIQIAAHANRRAVEIKVRDHGPGLPDYARDRVFEKFYSLARPATGKKGTGLGLVFVKEAAALHGGRAALANHPDGGAVATLWLPRYR